MQNLHTPSPEVNPSYHRDVHSGTASAALLGFFPAFMDVFSQEIHLSVNERGALATIHLLDGLPAHWVAERDRKGRVTALKDGIIAGYVRAGRFYSRADLAQMRWDS